MIGKKKVISVSQRKYFETRITEACDEQIANIRYVNASKIVEISKREHTLYLKNLKVNTRLDKYTKICKEMKKLEDELLPIIKTLKESLPQNKQSWDCAIKYTTICESYSMTKSADMLKAFEQLHHETMKDKNMGTKMNKQIAHVKAKQQEALDFLYGLDEIAGLKEGLNGILNEANIKLLGE